MYIIQKRGWWLHEWVDVRHVQHGAEALELYKRIERREGRGNVRMFEKRLGPKK